MKNYGTSTITEVDNYNIGQATFLDFLYSKVTDNAIEIQLTQYILFNAHVSQANTINCSTAVLMLGQRRVSVVDGEVALVKGSKSSHSGMRKRFVNNRLLLLFYFVLLTIYF